MCGICGFNWEDRSLIKRMTDVISHRGPDAEGHYVGNGVSLGNRRLSIIDLSEHGNQPIFNENKTICIVYNGEIYNFLELKKELESRGHKFSSHTDTEVIVHAYEEYGIDCLHKFNGMFAFALFDIPNRALFLARDRIGIKPLYYYWDGKQFLFGSEIKSILQSSTVQRKVNLQSLYYYIGYEFVPGPLTMFENMYKLNPAHYMIFKDGQITVCQYWDIKFEDGEKRDEEYYIQTLRELMDSSVKKRLISDVPLGVFLSGGLDSSTVVAFMRRYIKGKLQTFSIGYEHKTYSELDYAKFVAKYFDAEHNILMIHDITPEDIASSLWHLDEPMTDLSTIPFRMICKKARESVIVCLSGEGGDEVFVGYDRFKASKFYDRFFRWIPRIFQKTFIIPIIDALPDTPRKKGLINIMKRFIDGVELPEYGYHMRWQYFTNPLMDQNLYLDNVKGKIKMDGLSLVGDCANRCNTHDRLSKEIYIDTRFTMPDSVLMKVDKMSMANSLEVRVPFLDHRIIEFCANIPSSLKLKGFSTKYIFRKAIQGILPDKIVFRGKQGYSFPSKNWLRGQMREFMIDVVKSCPLLNECLNMDYVDTLIKEHLSWRRNHNHILWALINVAVWYKKFFVE